MNLQTRQVPCESFEEQWMQGIWEGVVMVTYIVSKFSHPTLVSRLTLFWFFLNLKKAIPGTLYWSTAGWLQCWQFAERVRWKGDQTQMRSPDNKCQQLPRQKSSKIGSIQDIRWQGWARRRQHMSGCMQVIWKEDRNGQSKCGLLSWSWSENIRLAGQSRPARTEHLTYTRWSGPYNRSRPKHHNS